MTNEQFEKPCDGNYGDRFKQAVEKQGNHSDVYFKIYEYFYNDVVDDVEAFELDKDSSEYKKYKNKCLSSDEMSRISHNNTKLMELTLHIMECVKNPADSSPEEVISGIEEMESILKKDEEMIENVLKLNNLSLEKLGFDSRYLSTPQYNPPPQYNSPQQYEAASKNSGCLGVVAVMIVIFLILI